MPVLGGFEERHSAYGPRSDQEGRSQKNSWAATAARKWRGALYVGSMNRSEGCELWRFDRAFPPLDQQVAGASE